MSAQTFSRTIELPVSASDAFAWHERSGALERLVPPWELVDIASRSGNLCDGATVELVNRIGPFKLRWVAEHYDVEPGKQFCDVQREGPFSEWNHLHLFRSNGSAETSVLEDRVKYKVPGGWLGRLVAGRWIRKKIERMFDYRHATTCNDLSAHAQFSDKQAMHIAVTGASGLVGSELCPLLTTGGHQVTRLVRGEAVNGEVRWDPTGENSETSVFDCTSLENVDAVVHLAGENIAGSRWTEATKQRIRDSRVTGTRSLCEALARMKSPPKVLIAASAIGYYGDTGNEIIAEASDAGSGFLCDVCQEWEAATQPAKDAGIRVVNLRIGVVLSPKGGALAKMLTPFKLGGGGVIGHGRQYWSWISVDDLAGAIHHAIMTDSLSGPVNAVAPNASTNREFTRTLGKVLRRPTIIPMPAFAARLALGKMANDLLLASTRVEPTKLINSGYQFRVPTLEKCLRHLLGK